VIILSRTKKDLELELILEFDFDFECERYFSTTFILSNGVVESSSGFLRGLITWQKLAFCLKFASELVNFTDELVKLGWLTFKCSFF
jgi:hypothetical protein